MPPAPGAIIANFQHEDDHVRATHTGLLIVALAANLACTTARSPEPRDQFDPAKRAIFTAEQIAAEAVAAKTPEKAKGAWTPTNEDVEDLERVLAPLLAAEIAREARPGDKPLYLRDYYRQYVGMTVKAKRMIFLNGLHSKELEVIVQQNAPDVWKRQVVTMAPQFGCRSLIAVYEVEARAFQDFRCPENIFRPEK